jgi:hypothetical protein
LECAEKRYDDSAEINYLLARCYIGQALIPQAKRKVEQAINEKEKEEKKRHLHSE